MRRRSLFVCMLFKLNNDGARLVSVFTAVVIFLHCSQLASQSSLAGKSNHVPSHKPVAVRNGTLNLIGTLQKKLWMTHFPRPRVRFLLAPPHGAPHDSSLFATPPPLDGSAMLHHDIISRSLPSSRSRYCSSPPLKSREMLVHRTRSLKSSHGPPAAVEMDGLTAPVCL